jgi:transposase
MFDGLSGRVDSLMRKDPLSGHLFVFFNKRRNQVRILMWDRSGYCLYCKRLEQGRFAIGLDDEVDHARLQLILEGIDLSHSRQRRRFSLPVCKIN